MIAVTIEVIDLHRPESEGPSLYELGSKCLPVWPDKEDIVTIDGKEYRAVMYRMWEVGVQSPEIILRVKPNWLRAER